MGGAQISAELPPALLGGSVSIFHTHSQASQVEFLVGVVVEAFAVRIVPFMAQGPGKQHNNNKNRILARRFDRPESQRKTND